MEYRNRIKRKERRCGHRGYAHLCPMGQKGLRHRLELTDEREKRQTCLSFSERGGRRESIDDSQPVLAVRNGPMHSEW